MGKEIKDSKDHLKQKEKAFVAKDCFALGVWKQRAHHVKTSPCCLPAYSKLFWHMRMKAFSCWLVSADSPSFYGGEQKEEQEERTK